MVAFLSEFQTASVAFLRYATKPYYNVTQPQPPLAPYNGTGALFDARVLDMYVAQSALAEWRFRAPVCGHHGVIQLLGRAGRLVRRVSVVSADCYRLNVFLEAPRLPSLMLLALEVFEMTHLPHRRLQIHGDDRLGQNGRINDQSGDGRGHIGRIEGRQAQWIEQAQCRLEGVVPRGEVAELQRDGRFMPAEEGFLGLLGRVGGGGGKVSSGICEATSEAPFSLSGGRRRNRCAPPASPLDCRSTKTHVKKQRNPRSDRDCPVRDPVPLSADAHRCCGTPIFEHRRVPKAPLALGDKDSGVHLIGEEQRCGPIVH
ncbi:hypothetical protein BDK51DRAFT_45617 [Blyttiomyces helicus]|uniref:Uncharacterized protein n=1 Tax=Blyttiomyces helicus TaxID=388810 RepID=A0A4P9W559_9FUNG|nr:hypothetical protein BDK51DRAFT_45617 [Blyttiomyces helicus]|eukprot:RKO86415.1 hypothetical protein BDK51DRAFT_45617 [Blyttiomyces helicus]